MAHCGGCASANERCGNGLEKIYPTTAVRFGRMRHIGEFSHPADMKFTCGSKVVIATDRGIEIGDQVSLTCFGCDQSVSRDQMRSYAEASGGDAYQLKKGRILREATEADLAEWRHLQSEIFDKLQTARRVAVDLNLQMKIVDCEHIFGGERIVLYFLAEERVDFRELVRLLAAEFQTRIEMRQIGARDEARLVADFETCGRECCCKNFLKTLKPISMQMAKLQKATLDPSKVSGRCGRLKCCLRYEHETYEALDDKLPRVGVWVKTSYGIGQVVDRQILTQLVKIRGDDDRLTTVVMEDVLEINVPPPPLEPRAENGDDRRRPPERGRSDSYPSRPPRGDRGPSSQRRQPAPPPSRVETGEDNIPDPASPDIPPADSSPGELMDRAEDGLAGPSAPRAAGPPVDSADDQARPGSRPHRPRGRRRGRRRRNDGGGGPRSSGGPNPNP